MIFISYRRVDAAGHAGRLFDRMVARFGRARVFMDVDTIQPGDDFARDIEERLGSCEVLVALIGDQWISAAKSDGQRRLDDPKDFVRLEIAAALQRGTPVIPVLVEETKMPAPEQLPEPLRPLTRLQALEISDARFDAETQELIRALERYLPRGAGRGPMGWISRRSVIASGLLLAGAAAAVMLRSRHTAPNDVSGRWLAKVSGPGGHTYSIVFELRAAGVQLLGTVTYPTGVGAIKDGRIEGRRISFDTQHVPQFEERPATIRFGGEFSAAELKLTMQSDTGVEQVVARREPKAAGQ